MKRIVRLFLVTLAALGVSLPAVGVVAQDQTPELWEFTHGVAVCVDYDTDPDSIVDCGASTQNDVEGHWVVRGDSNDPSTPVSMTIYASPENGAGVAIATPSVPTYAQAAALQYEYRDGNNPGDSFDQELCTVDGAGTHKTSIVVHTSGGSYVHIAPLDCAWDGSYSGWISFAVTPIDPPPLTQTPDTWQFRGWVAVCVDYDAVSVDADCSTATDVRGWFSADPLNVHARIENTAAVAAATFEVPTYDEALLLDYVDCQPDYCMGYDFKLCSWETGEVATYHMVVCTTDGDFVHVLTEGCDWNRSVGAWEANFTITPIEPPPIDAEWLLDNDIAPCEGPPEGGAWRNHGQYVSTVAHQVDAWIEEGFVTEEDGETLVSDRAQRDWGKKYFECP